MVTGIASTAATKGKPSSECIAWQECLAQLERKLSKLNFMICLPESQATVEADGVLHVRLSSCYRLEWLQQQENASVLRAVRQAVRRVMGESWEVVFSAPDGEEHVADVPVPRPQPRKRSAAAAEPALPQAPPSSDRRDRYRFENFVIGDSNQMAAHAASQIAERPNATFNPLFLYSESGMGKTHLMHAVRNKVMERQPSRRVVCTSTETFTNELLETLPKREGLAAFRQKYRHVDYLMVDDLEFLIGKERTQEEFYHTFEELMARGCQIVLTCDRPPQLLKQLNGRLCSRLSSGLIADIQPPTQQMRTDILKMRCREAGVGATEDALRWIAETLCGSVREMEGALVRVIAVAGLNGVERVDKPLAQRALRDVRPKEKHVSVTLDAVLDQVSKYYHIQITDLLGKRRDRRFSSPRHVAMYLAESLVGLPCRQIADAFGGRDYSSVQFALKKVREQCAEPAMKRDLDQIATALGRKA